MEIISGERIWSEWKKILSGRYAGQLTAKMIELGLAPYIGSKLPPVFISDIQYIFSQTNNLFLGENTCFLVEKCQIEGGGD